MFSDAQDKDRAIDIARNLLINLEMLQDYSKNNADMIKIESRLRKGGKKRPGKRPYRPVSFNEQGKKLFEKKNFISFHNE